MTLVDAKQPLGEGQPKDGIQPVGDIMADKGYPLVN